MGRQRHRRNKALSLYIWHRYAGLFASLFVIFITITGIVLNHTDDLTLKKKHINNRFVLDHYNVQAPATILRFKTAQHTITQADDMLFINEQLPISIDSSLKGAVKYAGFSLVALSDTLLLIDSNNQLIETLSELDGVPNTISHIGIDEQRRVHLLANNETFVLTDELTLNAIPSNNDVNWARNNSVSTKDKDIIIARYQSQIISVETLILDIHSGRFFGAYGALFFDFVGTILLFLAFTGLIIWLRQRSKKNQ